MGLLAYARVLGTVSPALLAVTALLACDERTAIVDPEPGSSESPDASKGLPNGSLVAPLATTDAEAEPPTTEPPAEVRIEVREDLMARWNGAASAADSAFQFQWTVFEQFPHPTYKGGSADAYRAFATVLLAFFQAGDNFDFLARNHLFTLSLTYVFPSGASGLDTTFQALAISFAAADGYGDIPLDVRRALQGIADRIQFAVSMVAAEPPPDEGAAGQADR